MNALGWTLLAAGLFFLTVGSIGILRFPDFYARLHASGKSDTLGSFLTMMGLACLIGWNLDAAKLVTVAVAVWLANATATHALARAAFRTGLEPWVKKPRGAPGGEGAR